MNRLLRTAKGLFEDECFVSFVEIHIPVAADDKRNPHGSGGEAADGFDASLVAS